MAHIVAILHEFDIWVARRGLLRRGSPRYMLFDVLEALRQRGHKVGLAHGPDPDREGDAAILHVDATVVAPDYVEVGRRFPVCLNLGATDISKRRVSDALLRPGDAWDGPVLVKSNLNSLGLPERGLNRRARRSRQPEPFPDARPVDRYRIYGSTAEVPPVLFDDPRLSVERFVPERDPNGFACRAWVFCGEAERCTRYVSPDWNVKAGNAAAREPAPVPAEMRRRRRELGFDYGKFDFVLHRGRPMLLDANKTPGRPAHMQAYLAQGAASLAEGFERMLPASR